MPFDNAIVVSAESNVSLAAATTAINTLLAAEIVTYSPQPVNVIGLSNYGAAGPLYGVSVVFKAQG